MTKNRLFKLMALCVACLFFSRAAQALPDYLKLYNADAFAKPELKGKCAVCHLNPAGGGPRNEFGKAFAAADHQITSALRNQFPAYFTNGQDAAMPNVSFAADHEAIVEINGKRYVINTQTKTVKAADGMTAQPAKPADIAQAKPKTEDKKDDDKKADVYKPVDVRVISLPSAVAIPKGSLWTDFTHRFPFGEPTDAKGAFGLDTIAYPSFGVTYGLTDRIHVGAYRSPEALGRPIQVFAGAQLLQETKGDPLSFQARLGVEGRDNFQRNFATSFEFTAARSITKYAQVYLTPTITLGDRPFSLSPDQEAKGTTAYALGGGVAVKVLPSVSLMAEVNKRVNEQSRYVEDFTGIRHAVYSFAIQKASASKRHGFTLVFSNGPGTTMSQRSQTRGLFGADDGLKGLTIGFNIVRRIF